MAFGIKQIKAFLSENGMPIEALDKVAEDICARHKADIDAIREERDEYKQKISDATNLKEELEKVKGELEKATAKIEQAEKDDYKGKYEFEKAEKEKLKADYEAKDKAAREDAAITEWALAKGYSDKGAKMIVKHGGLRGKVTFDKEGKATIADDLWNDIDSEWSDYKKPPETVDNVKVQKPPVNNGSKSTKTKAEIMEIKDAGERQKAIADNPELFGIPVEE